MVVRELKGRVVYILFLLGLGVLFLAYQARMPLAVDLGTRGDEAHIADFHTPEKVDGLSYRWSCHRSVVSFPGLAAYTPAILQLRLNGSRPAHIAPPQVAVLANGHELASFSVMDGFETYELFIDSQTMGISGHLEIEICSESFVPADVMGGNDLRQLGVMVDQVTVQLRPVSPPLVLPPPRHLLCLATSVAACFLWARQLAISTRISLLAAASLLVLIAALVVGARLWLGLQCWLSVIALAFLNVATTLARAAAAVLTGQRRISYRERADLCLLLGALVVLAGVFYIRFALWEPLREDHGTDFFISYTAATVLAEGGNAYDPHALRDTSRYWSKPLVSFDFGSLFVTHIAPPTHAVPMLLLVPLGYDRARIVFLLLNHALLLSSAVLVLRSVGGRTLRTPRLLLSLLVVLAFQPAYTSLRLGQVDFFVLFLLSLSYWGYRSDRKLIVGPCLAMAAAIKLFPAIMILYFLWKREYVIVASAAATALVAAVLSLLVAGRDALLTFAAVILPALLKGTAFFQNQGVNGFFSRLFVHPDLYYSLHELPSCPQACQLSYLASGALLAAGAYLTRHALSRKDHIRFDLGFSLAMIVMLLVSIISWDHYLTSLLLVFLVLLSPALPKSVTRTRYLAAGACGWAAYLLMEIPTTLYGMTLHSYPGNSAPAVGRVLLLSVGFYAQLLLFLSLAILLSGLHVDQEVEDNTQAIGQPAEGDLGVAPLSTSCLSGPQIMAVGGLRSI
jgi:hypothetical protein